MTKNRDRKLIERYIYGRPGAEGMEYVTLVELDVPNRTVKYDVTLDVTEATPLSNWDLYYMTVWGGNEWLAAGGKFMRMDRSIYVKPVKGIGNGRDN